MVFGSSSSGPQAGYLGLGREAFSRYYRVLIDLDEAMKAQDDVRHPQWFVDGEADGALDGIAGTVLAMGIGGLDTEVGDIARLRSGGEGSGDAG